MAQSVSGAPGATGLYDPANEHDACGMGFVADLYGRPSHGIVAKGLTVLERLAHRGASGAEEATGDGSGILVQVPTASCATSPTTPASPFLPPGTTPPA